MKTVVGLLDGICYFSKRYPVLSMSNGQQICRAEYCSSGKIMQSGDVGISDSKFA